MSLTIAMPQLGLTMTEGTVSTWHKQPGDAVTKDEIILVISTDKVDMDVEAPADGVIERIVVESGETVPVGTPLAYLIRPGEEPDKMLTVEEDPPEDTTITPATAAPSVAAPMPQELIDPLSGDLELLERSERIIASPRAKRLATEFGIDLAHVSGSGPRGRISADDVQRSNLKTVEKQPTDQDVKRRRIIADKMVESITTIPSFSVSLEINAENLVSLYESIKKPLGQAAGAKLTYTDLLLKALGLALVERPEMNTLWNNGSSRLLSKVALGLAVATDRGVVAPTLGDIDCLSLDQLLRQRAQLTEKARQGRLSFADMEGAAGTLSNLGMYRIDRFEGIITPGQTFILAVGKLRNRPWAEETLTIKPTVILNLSVDHRVADGAAAAVFLERVAEMLESPYQLLLERKQEAGRSQPA